MQRRDFLTGASALAAYASLGREAEALVGSQRALLRGAPVPAVPVLTGVVSSMMAPGCDDNNSGSELWGQYYSDYISLPHGPFSSIQLEYSNWKIKQAGGEDNGDSVTSVISAIVEYPIGGTQYPVTFSGAGSKSLTAGSKVLSDAVAGVTIPASSLFRIWTQRQCASGFFAIYNRRASQSPAGGSSKSLTGSSGTPGSALGSTTAGFASAATFNPSVIVGKSVTPKKFLMFIGESNMVDQAQDFDTSGVASWPSAASAKYPIYKCAASGAAMSQQGSLTHRLQVAQDYGVTDVFMHFSSNDLSNSRTLLQMQTDATTIAQAFSNIGKKVHLWTCNPFGINSGCGGGPTSPPAYESIRLAFNTWVRSQSGIAPFDVYYDWANFAATGSDSGTDAGFWKSCVSSSDALHYLQNNTGLRAALISDFTSYLSSVGLS